MPEVQSSLFDGLDTPSDLDTLKKDWSGCTQCARLSLNRKQVVFWDGNESATVMAIGQWPGKDEDINGIPLCGKLGQLARDIITGNSLVIPKEDIFWTNVIGCRIPDGEAFRQTYADNCHDLLEHQIQIVKPSLMVALGRVAMSRLTGKTSVKVAELEGKTGMYKGVPIVYMKHPAFINRVQDPRERKKVRFAIEEQAKLVHRLYESIKRRNI